MYWVYYLLQGVYRVCTPKYRWYNPTLRQQTITQFCVNYSVHHANFVQTIIVQLVHNKSI